MSFEQIEYEQSEYLATIVLDHPPANTLSSTLLKELSDAFVEIEKNKEVRVIIITGKGERFFSGGADITEFGIVNADEQTQRGQLLFRRIESLTKPVIAAINGFALGGGCELAMSCHLRYAADTARLGQPEINLGIIPGWGGTQRLPRLVGRTRAIDMMLSGRAITAQEAERYGLVNHVAPAAELKEHVQRVAQRIASAPPLAVRAILECVDAGLIEGLQKGLDLERENFGWIYQTEDAKTGVHAFLNKLKAEFKGK